MAKLTSNDYLDAYTDDDSGIDLDNGSSNDLNSSTLTLIESSPSYISQPRMSSPLPLSPPAPWSSTVVKKQFDAVPFIKFPSDGVIERIRPVTMRNSENGDYVLCRTNQGTYVAYRTPVVPQWITRLVEEIESREQ